MFLWSHNHTALLLGSRRFHPYTTPSFSLSFSYYSSASVLNVMHGEAINLYWTQAWAGYIFSAQSMHTSAAYTTAATTAWVWAQGGKGRKNSVSGVDSGMKTLGFHHFQKPLRWQIIAGPRARARHRSPPSSSTREGGRHLIGGWEGSRHGLRLVTVRPESKGTGTSNESKLGEIK